jgi:hypothetical protein
MVLVAAYLVSIFIGIMVVTWSCGEDEWGDP